MEEATDCQTYMHMERVTTIVQVVNHYLDNLSRLKNVRIDGLPVHLGFVGIPACSQCGIQGGHLLGNVGSGAESSAAQSLAQVKMVRVATYRAPTL